MPSSFALARFGEQSSTCRLLLLGPRREFFSPFPVDKAAASTGAAPRPLHDLPVRCFAVCLEDALQPSVLEFVDLVAAAAAKGAGRIGDAPAETVVLDLLDRVVPAGLLLPVGGRWADGGKQVWGRVGREVGGVDAAVVAQLGVEVPEAGSGGGDLLAGWQVGEPVIELVEGCGRVG
jgi:hypothetical protein